MKVNHYHIAKHPLLSPIYHAWFERTSYGRTCFTVQVGYSVWDVWLTNPRGDRVRCYVGGLRVPRWLYAALDRLPCNALFWMGGYQQGGSHGED